MFIFLKVIYIRQHLQGFLLQNLQWRFNDEIFILFKLHKLIHRCVCIGFPPLDEENGKKLQKTKNIVSE